VEVCLGKMMQRTNVHRKSLNPAWNETLKFEITSDDVLLLGKSLRMIVDAVTVCGAPRRC
jgi:hypothetical protein